jgi:hydroxyacyl-ACP dehydratase HTD2-like protein with hotdog domain
MGGGQELEFLVPVRPGDRFTRTERVTDIYERESRAGRLVFVVVEQVYRNQRGETAVICRATTIFH